MSKVICLSVFLLFNILVNGSVGQLAFHSDPHTNSFSVKAPGYQQTFTRYFGGQANSILQQTASSQPQAQIAAAHHGFQQPEQVYPTSYSKQVQPHATQLQPQYISAQDYAAFLQNQQSQQQPSQYNAQQYYEQQPQASSQSATATAAPQSLNANLLGVAFSPSSQVSHVKFSSGDLSYNF